MGEAEKQVRRGGRVGQFPFTNEKYSAQRVSGFVGMPLCNLRAAGAAGAAMACGLWIKSRSTKPWSFIVFVDVGETQEEWKKARSDAKILAFFHQLGRTRTRRGGV